MTSPQIVNLARTMVNYSTSVGPGDHVGIITSPEAAPLIHEVVRHVLRAGGYPYVLMGLERLLGLDGLDQIFFEEANDDQLSHVLRTERMVREEFDVMLTIYSQSNTHNLASVDPARYQRWVRARKDMLDTFLRRGASGELRWCVTLYPTRAYAQDADMSLAEFERFVYSATYADEPDAVESWKAIHVEQQHLVEWLAGRRQVVVKGPNVDLELSIDGRTFLNSGGKHNLPDGEIFTGPVEDSVEGWVRFTYPVVHEGREVHDVELLFEKGRVTKATASKNQGFLLSQLDSDHGARYLGEFAIGTNARVDRFIKNILFDEKLGGTIHMAVGAGYPETGSKNHSAIHWDMICDMRQGGQITVDGVLFYDSGRFVV
jgi:aminopeptidase